MLGTLGINEQTEHFSISEFRGGFPYGIIISDITTEGMSSALGIIRDNPFIRSLYLSFTQVADAGLADLRKMTGLRHLDLSFTRVGDAGLVHLSGLTGLQHLNLSDTRVADAGLAHLRKITKLETLVFR